MISVRRLVWDPWNVAHIARHAVMPEEVEQVCLGSPMVSVTYAGRLRIMGPTSVGRMLTVIVAPEDSGAYYTVTARAASRKERRAYVEARGGDD